MSPPLGFITVIFKDFNNLEQILMLHFAILDGIVDLTTQLKDIFPKGGMNLSLNVQVGLEVVCIQMKGQPNLKKNCLHLIMKVLLPIGIPDLMLKVGITVTKIFQMQDKNCVVILVLKKYQTTQYKIHFYLFLKVLLSLGIKDLMLILFLKIGPTFKKIYQVQTNGHFIGTRNVKNLAIILDQILEGFEWREMPLSPSE